MIDEPPTEDGNEGMPNAFEDLESYVAGPSDRIELMANAVAQRAEVDRLVEALNQADMQTVFQFASQTVVMNRMGSMILRGRNGVDKIVRSVPRTANRGLLVGPVERAARFVKWVQSREAFEEQQVPLWATTLLSDINGEGLDILNGIADFPVMSGKGTLLCGRSGYDRKSGLFVDCEPIPMDGNKFEGDPRAAYKFLSEGLLADFPFATPQDLSRALVIPLTIMTRRTMLDGGCPVPFITAPEPNTGKTMLAKVLVEVVTDQPLPVSSWDHDNEQERRKMWVAIGLENPASVLFDNINNGWSVKDGTLDKWATSDSLSDRLLGKSQNVNVPTTTLPIFTGNNISAGSPDLESRAYEIRMMKPAKRVSYTRRDPMQWVRDNRIKVIHALVAILSTKVHKSWVPESRFPKWAEVVGGPLQYAADDKEIFSRWKEDVGNHWDEELENLCYAMANCKDGNSNKEGYLPGEMSERFSVLIHELEPKGTSQFMKSRDGLLVMEGKIPVKQVYGFLKKYNGHMAGPFRFKIERKPISGGKKHGRMSYHFRAEAEETA